MENPPNEAAIKASFANVLPKINRVAKDGDNPYFSSKYQTLDAIQRMLKPALLEEGLSYSQHVDYIPEGQCVAVTTMLWNSNGDSLNLGITRLPVPKMTPQDAGSAFSYAKRYALGALFAIEVGEDDDAEKAQNAHRGAPARAATPAPTRAASPAPSAARAREGQGWDEEPKADEMLIKGRKWVLKDMNVNQLSTVAYTGSYLPKHIEQCTTELLRRVAAGDEAAIKAVEANSQP